MSQSFSDPTSATLYSGKEGKIGQDSKLGALAVACYHPCPLRAESGFTHVEPEKYEPRLLHFKGLRVRWLQHNTITYNR